MSTPKLDKVVADVAAYFDNQDTPGQERAVEALAADRPAYWLTSGSVSGLYPLWRDYINREGGVRAGLNAYLEEFGRAQVEPKLIPLFMARLVPLNAAAADDLGSAYFALLSTWRESEELERRNPLFPRVTRRRAATERAMEKL